MRDNPFTILGLADDATAEEVNTAFKELARTAHPDLGGDANAFIKLTKARRAAIEEIAKRPCPECHGTGKITAASGFAVVRQTCLDCNGTGRKGAQR